MARLPRLSIPGELHLVRVQGNNRQAFLLEDEDFAFFHALWLRESQRHGVQVHAYVFLPHEAMVLLTPKEEGSLTPCMQAIGRLYVSAFNKKHQRTGTLWQGRFRSTLLEPEEWLMPTLVYLDWAPVRAGLSESTEAPYKWSSHAHYSGLQRDPLIDAAQSIWSLGNTPFARERAYAEMVHQGISSAQVVQISHALDSGWPLGAGAYVAKLQSMTTRRLSPKKAGRPKKSETPGS